MISLLQRVSQASVSIDGNVNGEIKHGLLVLLAIEHGDDESKAKRMADRIAGYRIFNDEHDKMNLNVGQVGGDMLVVSQFTLAADTNKGMRPSFSNSAEPEVSKHLYTYLCEHLRSKGFTVPTGIFAADMQVSLINDGPVTFTLTV